MGQCCVARDETNQTESNGISTKDIEDKETNVMDKTEVVSETGGSERPDFDASAYADVTSLPHIANYIARFIEIGSKTELIIFTLTYAEVPIFFRELEAIIGALQNVGETYMPIGIVSNSLHIETEVIIVMRCISQIYNFPPSGWVTGDPAVIASRYTLENIQGPSGKHSASFKDRIDQKMADLYSQEKKIVVGGYQRSDRSVCLLLYQLDQAKAFKETSFIVKVYSEETKKSMEEDDGIFAESPESRSKLLLEKITNEAHYEEQGHLRCIISLRYPTDEHFFIFQQQDGDRFYMVLKFTEYIDQAMHKQKTKWRFSDNVEKETENARTNFDIFLTELLTKIELKIGENSCLTGLMMADKMNDSYAITST